MKAAGFLHRTERLRDSASIVSPIEFTTGTVVGSYVGTSLDPTNHCRKVLFEVYEVLPAE
jgi:hypothetical protein